MEAAFFAKLTGDAGVSALVSARVYPVKAPQAATRPFLTYRTITRERVRSIDGFHGLTRYRVQVDSWDDDHDGAVALADAVTAAIEDFQGAQSGVTFNQVSLTNELHDYDDDAEIHRVIQDWLISVNE